MSKLTVLCLLGAVCFALADDDDDDCRKPCPRNYSPVCGSDGKTYSNLCELLNANCDREKGRKITAVFNGECIKRCYSGEVKRECPVSACYLLLNPICGSDGKTYDNDCVLDGANCGLPDDQKIKPKSCGPCPTTCRKPCTFIYAPVCGSDGKTYASQCVLDNANCGRDRDEQVTVAFPGDCIKRCYPGNEVRPCPIVGCNRMLRPVCGSDGRTYSNDCLLDSANCALPEGRKIVPRSCGPCKKRDD
ncbi:four-domain proteases inhibitor-like [Physella acuta]|uniref:four-domain proteases inhibitor-like n=1 Tax=Physella acuta TaxID=109671 RepID=UPI0027DD8E8D|nr:four-domain proteases inhibitor-like [Physella acuta]